MAGLGTILLTAALLHPTLAQGRNFPGRRVAAGTRGECLIVAPGQQDSLPLVVLLPDSNLSLTTQAHPEFFWFNPPIVGQAVVFELRAVNANLQSQQLVYTTQVPIEPPGRLHGLQLPDDGSVPPLEVGQLYRWSVTPLCSEEAERNLVWRVTGWVERIAAPDTPPGGTAAQQALAAAAADRWLDAFSTLKQAMCQAPATQSANADTWTTLLDQLHLESLQIDLPQLKQQAIAHLDSLCE